MVKTLDRKLLRDLGQLRGQVITICLVVAAGIAAYIVMQTTYRSLHQSMDSYYEEYRFPQLFAQARRVPANVEGQLRSIPGVELVYARTTEAVRVPLDDQDQAAAGRIVSLPDRGRPPLNDVYILHGRAPDAEHLNEALLLESFAEAHGIAAGDRMPVVINGTLREVVVTGLAMSPEFVLAMGGDMLSFEPGSYAVIWMRQTAVAGGFGMDGAFNDVMLRLQPGASEASVIDSVNGILAPYGGFGAYGRDKHISHHFIESELASLEVMATIIPLIFLCVAAFLVNVVLGRLVQLQRGQIATLKSLGYSNASVGLHFLKLVSLIVLLGSVVGIGAGAWLGSALTSVYQQYFRFPVLESRLSIDVVLVAVMISLASAVAGAIMSVRQIAAMPPAEAMRPPAPPTYRTTWLDLLTRYILGALGRMVLRELSRRPARVLVSSLGIAFAVAILVIGRFSVDSMDHLMDLHFSQAMKEDLTVALRHPLPERAGRSLLQLPGVTHSEGHRSVPVRIRAGSAMRDTVIQGFPEEGRLRALLNREGEEVAFPLDGMLLTDVLAERLGVEPGELVDLTLIEGNRRTVRILVSGTVSDMLGMQGYMRLSALRRLLGEEPTVSMVLLSVEPEHQREVQRRLYDMPTVASVGRPAAARENFENQQGGTMLAMTLVLAFFASIIAIGIVYNNARVSLSIRSRDLASMRVLGFTRAEISSVLLGELAVQVVLALPLGMWLGTVAADAMMSVDPENFRMPVVISAKTYAFAAMITIGSALVSGLLVRRKLDKLDLIEVLKTRE